MYLTRSLSTLSRRPTRVQAISLDRDDVLSGLEEIAQGLPAFTSPSLKDVSETSPPTSPVHSLTSGTSICTDDLRKISIFGLPYDKGENSKAAQHLFQILSNSRSLTHLELPTCFARTLPLPDLIANKLPNLERFSLMGSHDSVPLKDLLPIIKASFYHPQLKEIEYDCGIRWPYFPEPADDQELEFQLNSLLESLKTSDQGEQKTVLMSKLQSLILPSCESGYPPSFLINLFSSRVPNVERLGAFSIQHGQNISSKLERAIASGCPKLQHILSPTYNSLDREMTSIRAMYRACSNGLGLKSFYARMFSDEDNFENGQSMIETFVEQNSETLEVFDIPYSYAVDSKHLQSILSSCKNLKRYCGYNNKDGHVAFAFKDIVSKEWACRDLKELCIQLNRRDRRLDYDIKEDDERFQDGGYNPTPQEFGEMNKMAKDVYAQIGRLSELEGLAICCDEDELWDDIEEAFKQDLTLENGWLKELVGLKELKHFQMMTNFWSCMGQAEVEFMHENWPCLERVTFGYGWSSSGNHVWEEPHWQWLKSQRPSLEYGYDFDDEYNLVQKRRDIQ
ncbi:hypothetical protein BGX26_001402 [Mortierella sp. AD094]|nr:hypothetical protein BGX26_001402 [Mortierella sp. AD094]